MIFRKKKSGKNAYDFEFTSIKGDRLPLSDFRGKVILIVNTASECIFTKQYAELQELWHKYKKYGLVILGIPSNDFGGQEPGANQEIGKFCKTSYGVSFPMTSKEIVRGRLAHPFYKWAREVLGGHTIPRWNFHKYLISRDGELVDFFVPFTKPMSRKVTKIIEKHLQDHKAPNL